MLQIMAKCQYIMPIYHRNVIASLGVSTTHSSGGTAASPAMNADVEVQKWGMGARFCPAWYHLALL